MFNRYTIEITPSDEHMKYNCTPTKQLSYSAKFTICECSIIYTEPIVTKNGNIVIILFIRGIRTTAGLLSYTEVTTDPNISTLATKLAQHHNTEVAPIEHSLNRAKVIIKERHGRTIDLCGCVGEAMLE